ncbi:superinfection immunity protein [Enterobacter cloacae]|uniref:superinfection immunity protein n=1 Tax=Enterobacter cloacae TaxID=550 RepID=UPI00317D6B67
MSFKASLKNIVSNLFLIAVLLFCLFLVALLLKDLFIDKINGNIEVILVILFLLAVYLLPSINAFNRWHKDKKAVLALNLFLGWTAIGWIGSLIWSFTGPNLKKERLKESYTSKTCPHCAELVKIDARICRFCQREL